MSASSTRCAAISRYTLATVSSLTSSISRWRARQQTPAVADATYDADFGPTGRVILNVVLTLSPAEEAAQARGAFSSGRLSDLPVLYDAEGRFAKVKLESLALYYGNDNAWYGRPDLMLAGNPLVDGKPSGRGYEDWIEGFAHFGVYGITPVRGPLHFYAGLSAIASASLGQELFTDETREHIGMEDAYAGFVTGSTSEAGDRWVLNVSGGRQRFLLGDGFLIANTSANGQDRAALQSNPRWASDMLWLAQLRFNQTKFELFYLDPDELPILDTGTAIEGVNLESRVAHGLEVGAAFLRVPRSSFGYFTLMETFTRKGLQVYDLRLRWQPNTQAGVFLAAEAAMQRNEHFPMRAWGMYAEGGWIFAGARWSPTLSYRYARFTGDDPDTRRFERWDPLLSGGTGEQWVQGINHFKVVQDSNLVAHRFQARLRPTPQIELVPQFWVFRAESSTNLGGNPALSFLDSRDLGTELNLTAKYFPSRRIFIQGHVAATFPGSATKRALGRDAHTWWSTMLFVRVAF